MTDDDAKPIPPALSAEEWAEVEPLADGGYSDELYSLVSPGTRLADLPKVIALANAALPDASPYKITRTDCYDLATSVNHMESLAAGLEDRPDLNGPAYAYALRRHANMLKTVAAKLAALLPPL